MFFLKTFLPTAPFSLRGEVLTLPSALHLVVTLKIEDKGSGPRGGEIGETSV
jgi:hypothetical protein